MVQVTYPGVYIQEVSSGVHTITSVGTSITAFIDFFREGPMDEAVEIFGMADFQRIFGGLDDRSDASYAIAQYFLNGGSSAYVIRVAGTGIGTGAVILRVDAAGGSTQLLRADAASAGLWGNTLRIDIDHNVDDPAGKLFNLVVSRYDGPGPRAKPLGVERYLNVTLDSTKPRYAVNVVNANSHLVRLTHLVSSDVRPAATGTVSGALDTLVTADYNGLSADKIDITVTTAAGATVSTATLDTWAAGSVTTLKQLRSRLEDALQKAAPAQDVLSGASVEIVGNGLRILAGRNGKDYDPSAVLSFANSGGDTAATVLKLVTAANASIQQYALGLTTSAGAQTASTVGADGGLPGPLPIVGNPALFTGLYALDRVDLFNILCIPRAVAKDIVATPAQIDAIYSPALAFCERKRAFLLIDVPEDIDEVAEAKDWLDDHATLRHRNAALYFPRTQIPDPVNDFRLRSVAASGTMAGIFARTDNQRGVWKAPAGVEAVLNGVVQLDIRLTDAENGVLNPLAINCLRTFPVYGGVAWGARTLVGADQLASEWKYVPIRRLALMLEESLFRGTKWVVFEPNDEPLWAKIRLNVGAYMNSLFRQGAFQGATPKEAYFVKCDAETTTQDDRNKGIVNIQVGFAPLKPAEFVVISIQQIAGDL